MHRVYTVGISKFYFSDKKLPFGREFFDIVKVVAETRKEAAEKAWELNCRTWLKLTAPKQTSVRKISLHVNDPTAGTGGLMSRLEPILVYTD